MARIICAVVFCLYLQFSFAQTKQPVDTVQPNIADFKVTLLGTGTPNPGMTRFGPSILVQAGSETLVFDAGRGCLQRLRQLNIAYDKINAIFVTHLHSDHLVGLPDLWLIGWLLSNRKLPMNLYGPSGISDMAKHLQLAFAYDMKMRIEDDHAPAEGGKFLVTEIKQGTIYEKNGVKVTAIEVDHFPIVPAFGYRIDYHGHSVVLSGDTRYSENLIRFAKGTDLLVHEVVVAPDTLSKTDAQYHIFAHHTTIEETVKIFNTVKPKFAAYSHIVFLRGQSEKELTGRTKDVYAGKLVIGEDLMNFSIGENVIANPWVNHQ